MLRSDRNRNMQPFGFIRNTSSHWPTMYFLCGLILVISVTTVASENTTTKNVISFASDDVNHTVTNNVTRTANETFDLTFNEMLTSRNTEGEQNTSNVTYASENWTTSFTESVNISQVVNATLNGTAYAESSDSDEQLSDVNEKQETSENVTELSSNKTHADTETLRNTTTMITTDKTTMIASTEVTIISSESNDIPGYMWFVLILDGNCSINDNDLENLRDRVEDGVTHWFEIGRRDLSIRNTSCSSPDQMLVNITMFRKPGANISALLASLEDLGRPLVRVKNHDYYVYKILTVDGYINKEPDIDVDTKHSDVELVIYIAVGSSCAFMILLIIALLLCKYCNCRDPKQFDFGDAPNLNMRLEDYTLTRIPRPKLGYVEYYRGLSKRYSPLDDKIVTSPNGMVQPFDTSVVPLEDAAAAHARDVVAARTAPPYSTFKDYRDGIIVRPSDINRFGQSLTRIYRSGRGKIVGKQRALTTDGDGHNTRSTENLHKSHKEDRFIDRGLDNPVYH